MANQDPSPPTGIGRNPLPDYDNEDVRKQELKKLQRKAYDSVMKAFSEDITIALAKKREFLEKLIKELNISKETQISVKNQERGDISLTSSATSSPTTAPASGLSPATVVPAYGSSATSMNPLKRKSILDNENVRKQKSHHLMDPSSPKDYVDPCDWIDIEDLPSKDVLWPGEDPGFTTTFWKTSTDRNKKPLTEYGKTASGIPIPSKPEDRKLSAAEKGKAIALDPEDNANPTTYIPAESPGEEDKEEHDEKKAPASGSSATVIPASSSSATVRAVSVTRSVIDLPTDLLFSILARIRKSEYQKTSLTCRLFRSQLLAINQDRRLPVYYVLMESTGENLQPSWYILNRQSKLARISLPPMPSGAATVSLGDKIYVIGGCLYGAAGRVGWTNTVIVIDTTDHSMYNYPSMRRTRYNPFATAINDSIFVFGGCDGCADWLEILNTKTRIWMSVEAPLKAIQQPLKQIGVFNNRIYLLFEFSTLRYCWSSQEWDELGRQRYIGEKILTSCVKDHILYTIDRGIISAEFIAAFDIRSRQQVRLLTEAQWPRNGHVLPDYEDDRGKMLTDEEGCLLYVFPSDSAIYLVKIKIMEGMFHEPIRTIHDNGGDIESFVRVDPLN